MSKVHFIAMDTHCHSTDICVKTQVDGPARRFRVNTSIQAIREVLEGIKRPRRLTFEEGPLADWLFRGLKEQVDEVLVCDPRKNALVTRDGDKDDAIDSMKLCDLFLGGYLRRVHHADTLDRQAAKQTVGLYHERVCNRVRCANKAIGLLKRWGVLVKEADFSKEQERAGILEALSQKAAVVRDHAELLFSGYDEALREELLLHREVQRLGKANEQVVRWEALPGIGWIRAMTFYVYVDTPWRFAGKSKLWKYMGIGLVREQSGGSRGFVQVSQACNHQLKGMIIGAAESVIRQKSSVFYRQYEWWRESGLAYKNARRNVARSMASVMWGMWKNGAEFKESLVGSMGDA